jgi:hypothetical protein
VINKSQWGCPSIKDLKYLGLFEFLYDLLVFATPAEFLHTECHYAKCHYAECCRASFFVLFVVTVLKCVQRVAQ